MKIHFKKLHIHHFLSIDDSTIDLNDKGYCLVKGVNNNPKDAAKSNGSGKSSIWNAICFVLVGETISGLKSNLANIYFNDGCYVELEFTVDKNEYKLIRSKDDSTLGTNLKIYINGEDKSGKGIRESQLILDEYLPDLTRELVGGVILLGQGLPDKFTSNSPSGRKEVLEHLSKSDFMIEDLRNRINQRLITLTTNLRQVEDSKLGLESKKSVYEKNLTTLQSSYESLSQNKDFDSLINQYSLLIEEAKDKIKEHEEEIKKIEQSISDVESNYNSLKEKQLEEILEINNLYNDSFNANQQQIFSLEASIKSVKQEIFKIDSIKDVCPTCGRPFEGVVKPDVTPYKNELMGLEEKLKEFNEKILSLNEEKQTNLNHIKDKYESQINEEKTKINSFKENIKIIKEKISILNTGIDNNNSLKIKEEANKENHLQNLKRVEEDIKETKKELNTIDSSLSTQITKEKDLNDRIDVVSKMNTYIKRDFRGILLSNIIDYINLKAKEYCSKIFNTDEIEFALDGNDIDITYCKKDYENLSGGEKQRIDIITQFAIRDMMSKYLNFSSNILVLDEITDNLDSDSCDRVINFITNELKDIESVFIISHHNDLELPYDSEITVVKNDLGISEVL